MLEVLDDKRTPFLFAVNRIFHDTPKTFTSRLYGTSNCVRIKVLYFAAYVFFVKFLSKGNDRIIMIFKNRHTEKNVKSIFKKKIETSSYDRNSNNNVIIESRFYHSIPTVKDY